MTRKQTRPQTTAWLAAALTGGAIFATQIHAETIDLRLESPANTYTTGDAVDVEVYATTSAQLVGFGFDLIAGDELDYNGYDTGPAFTSVRGTPDGDGIAGLAFSGALDGVDILLGTAHYDAALVGEVLVQLTTTAGDLTEGFARFGTGFFDVNATPLSLSIVEPHDTLPPVVVGGGGGGGSPPVPEPATISLLAAGLLATLRRRR